MCVTSMVVDHYHDKWQKMLPYRRDTGTDPWVQPFPWKDVAPQPAITDEEIRELRELLDKARLYDKEHNQPDCEMEEKRAKLKKLAKELGVEIDFV